MLPRSSATGRRLALPHYRPQTKSPIALNTVPLDLLSFFHGPLTRPISCLAALCLGAGPLLVQAQSAGVDKPDPATLARYDINKNGKLDADELRRKEAAAAARDEKVVEFSPFVVQVEKDDDFAAVASGDGTRLGLEIRDMPAAYMSITREFMDSLAITDLQGASSWATNSGVTVDPQGSDAFANVGGFLQRFRGITVAGGQQRDFFNNPGTMDSYSLERVDFGRGPNAALFNPGLLTGSSDNALTGVQSAQSKRARLDRPFETVRLRVGSWDYYRGEIDVNHPVNEKFAFRLNGVRFDREGWRTQEFEKVKGIALAATYRLAQKTEIRVSANNDTTRRNVPGLDVWDQISGWDGQTVFEGPVTNQQFSTTATPGALVSGGRTLTFNGEPQGVNRRSGVYYVYVPGAGQVMNFQNEAVTRRGDETTRTPIYANGTVYTRNGSTTALPYGNGGSQGTTPSILSTPDTNVDFRDAINLPADRFARAIANSNFRIPADNFAISTGEPLFTQWNKDANIAFTHQIGRDWFFEAGFDLNDTHNRHLNALTGGWARTALDLNRYTPDGASNPYFLQPYNDATLRETHRLISNRSVRLNLAHNRNLGKWGSYQFNLNMGRTDRDTDHYDRMYGLGLLPDPRMGSGSDEQVRFRFYWSNPDLSYSPTAVPASLFRRDFSTDNNTWTTSTQQVRPRWVPLNWQNFDEKVEYVALATAARFFDNKLVFVLSPRYDRYYNHTKMNPVFGDLPINWDGQPNRIYRPDAPADYTTLTYDSITGAKGLAATTRPRQNTINPVTGLPYVNNNGVQDRNPAYAAYRFRDDYNPPIVEGGKLSGSYGFVYHLRPWFSLLANYGTSYATPLPNNFQLGGEIVNPREGRGRDLAIRAEFFERRLAVKLSHFVNEEEFVRIDPPIKSPINGLLSRNSASDPTTDGRNQRGVSDIIGTDYQSQKTSGFELEIVGKITRNWRILANVGTNEVVTFDRYPLALDFLRGNSDLFVQVLQDAGGMLDTSQHPNGAPGVAVVNPAVTPAIASERTNAITDFNNIWTQAGVILNDRPLATENGLVVNLNTDYTIQSGLARGLRVGVAAQWKGDQFIGYRTGDTIVDSAGNVVLAYPEGATDDNRIFFKMPIDVSLTAAYRWKLKDRREIECSLVVRNVLDRDATFYAGSSEALRPTDGDMNSRTRTGVAGRLGGFQVPRNLLFTTTLRF